MGLARPSLRIAGRELQLSEVNTMREVGLGICLMIIGVTAGAIFALEVYVKPLRAQVADLELDAATHSTLRKAGLDVWCRWAYENDAL